MNRQPENARVDIPRGMMEIKYQFLVRLLISRGEESNIAENRDTHICKLSTSWALATLLFQAQG